MQLNASPDFHFGNRSGGYKTSIIFEAPLVSDNSAYRFRSAWSIVEIAGHMQMTVSELVMCKHLDLGWARSRQTLQYFSKSMSEIVVRSVVNWSDAATNLSGLVRSCRTMSAPLLTL